MLHLHVMQVSLQIVVMRMDRGCTFCCTKEESKRRKFRKSYSFYLCSMFILSLLQYPKITTCLDFPDHK
jgi:hypothetical protein